jgi:hypothetical protein
MGNFFGDQHRMFVQSAQLSAHFHDIATTEIELRQRSRWPTIDDRMLAVSVLQSQQ